MRVWKYRECDDLGAPARGGLPECRAVLTRLRERDQRLRVSFAGFVEFNRKFAPLTMGVGVMVQCQPLAEEVLVERLGLV